MLLVTRICYRYTGHCDWVPFHWNADSSSFTLHKDGRMLMQMRLIIKEIGPQESWAIAVRRGILLLFSQTCCPRCLRFSLSQTNLVFGLMVASGLHQNGAILVPTDQLANMTDRLGTWGKGKFDMPKNDDQESDQENMHCKHTSRVLLSSITTHWATAPLGRKAAFMLLKPCHSRYFTMESLYPLKFIGLLCNAF